jgi:DNA (cytosine-5)-methyltransferase 1
MEYIKIKKPKTFNNVEQVFRSHTLNEILPYLPDEDCFFDSRHWVYDTTEGVLPFSVTTRIDANNQQFLKEMKEDKETLRIPQATSQGCVEIEKPHYYEGTEEPSIINPLNGISNKGWHFEQQVYDANGITRTVKAGGGSGNIPKVVTDNTNEWKTIIGNKQMNPFRGDVEEISPCITSACGAGGGMTPMLTDAELETTKTKDFIEQVRGHQPINYRIRKLTPREVFRLMGVSETDIDKIQAAGISNSQQYKMAGNSIVVDVLEHIFRKLFVDRAQESQQLWMF